MPSSIQFTTPTDSRSRTASIYTRPQKKQKMSITQTYFLAHSARGKLSKEAARADHDLRLLVGHANLLDSLMLDLASAEQEQEQWFTKSVSQSEEAVEDPEADWQAEDAEDSESESDDDEDIQMIEATTEATIVTATEVDDEDFEEDDEEDYGDLALTRTASRHSPPELSSDSESDSEDEPMPPSPPTSTFDAFTENQRQAIANPPKDASLSESQQEAFLEEGFFLPSRPHQQQHRPQPQPSMIAAC
jgi:hypothetical protein